MWNFYHWKVLFDCIHFLPLGTDEVESPRVVNVILPEHRGYFVQHLGYFLATFLLLAFIVVAVIVLTRRRKKRGIVCVCACVCVQPINSLKVLVLYLTTCLYFIIIKGIFIMVGSVEHSVQGSHFVDTMCLRLCVNFFFFFF